MKHFLNRFAALTSTMLVAQLAFSVNATELDNKLVIIHTNDIHCSIDRNMGYDGLAAYRDQWVEDIGEDYVVLMDAGDVIQGGPLGTLTSGQALIDIMNAVGYDYFAPGNHEFDFGMEQGLHLMNQLTATILSSNFVDLTTGELVYAGYDVRDFGDVQIGFVGVTTPESMTKATPTYFQDENGEYIYSFGETGTDIYDLVQEAIDAAIAEGADFIVGVGHMGIDEASSPWRSTDLIQETTGFDIFLDGHSHTMDAGTEVLDKEGNVVVVNQAGSKFDAVGEIIIDLDTLEFTVGYVDEDYAEKSEAVSKVMDDIQEEFDVIMAEVVASSDVDLLMSDPETEENFVRNQETNLGNLVADAYRALLGTDVSISNGGGIRANIMAGDITYENIISVHPFNNEAAIVEVTGQILLDALEMGAKNTPENSGGFFQVSGMTYEINTAIENSIVTDDIGNFISVDGAYRVGNVMVGDEPLDLEKTYTLGAIDYILLNYGDGMTMFEEATLVDDHIMVDNEVLIRYIEENLNGVVGEAYSELEGRITIIHEEVETPEVETPEVETPEVETPEEETPEVETPEVEVPEVETPEVEVPEVETPEVETPEVETPEVETPEVEVPEVETPEVEVPEVEVPEVEVPEVEVPEVETPEVEVPEVDKVQGTHIVKYGDTLWYIARDYLGSGTRWNEIYEINRDVLSNPNRLSIGQILRVSI